MSPGGRPLRFFLGAFGEPGHAFPMLALGARLVQRGHEVTFETWSRWRPHVEEAGMRFLAAPEYPLFPGEGEPFEMYEAVVRATGPTREAVASVRPHTVIHDILTLAPAMAGELEGVPVATLVPHVYPVGAPGFPPYALGARLPRTRIGSRLWSGLARTTDGGLRQGRAQLNDARARLGLPAVQRLHGGLSEGLCLVGTFPQIEYPRRWPAGVEVTGPMSFEIPHPEIELPPGEEPLVLVAPSTAHDSRNHLVRTALAALAEEPVRVVATTNRVVPQDPIEVPGNAVLVEWLSYSQLMPAASLVISHGGHGTVARALSAGTPLLISPFIGDMSETAMRVGWAGAGLSLPWRLCRPAPLRWAARRVIAEPAFTARAGELAAWAREHDGGERGAELVERLAARSSHAGATA